MERLNSTLRMVRCGNELSRVARLLELASLSTSAWTDNAAHLIAFRHENETEVLHILVSTLYKSEADKLCQIHLGYMGGVVERALNMARAAAQDSTSANPLLLQKSFWAEPIKGKCFSFSVLVETEQAVNFLYAEECIAAKRAAAIGDVRA